MKCRSCGGENSELVLDLGLQPLANNLLSKDDLGKSEPKFPLRLAVCTSCWLMQIVETIPPVTLFSEYLYFSSFSKTMLEHAETAAKRYIREFDLGPGSLVVEIASNDGYFLKNFVGAGIPSLGIEPAANIAKVAREKGIDTLVDFFGAGLADRVGKDRGKADLILGNNVFAHAPNPNDFVGGLKALLKPGGSVVLEFPYGVDFIENNEFDTIYHEHVFYFTLTALLPLFARHELEVWRAERIAIHGGSLRICLSHPGQKNVETSMEGLLAEEKRKGIASKNYYSDFARKVEGLKRSLLAEIAELKKAGKKLAAYGASAKGSTLLNYYGLGPELEFVADRSTYKQGRFTPGTHIPIVAAEELMKRQPDYTLLLTWNFAEEILQQQVEYRKRGGKFIIPIPEVKVV